MSIGYREDVLNKGWKRYVIMHKNRRVASIREDGTCTIYCPSFMPYSLWLEKGNDMDIRINNLNSFYYWCATRVLTLDRKYAKEILNALGTKQAVTDRDRAKVALSYHCLNLTDVYWVRQDGEKADFDSICLYNHSLSGAFADVSLSGRALTAANAELLTPADAAGDISTQGVAPKAWIRRDGSFYLLKDGEQRDVEAELLASKIMDHFRIEHVSYSEGCFEGKKVSESRLITDTSRSIVSMEAVDIYCVNHGLDRTRFILDKDGYSYHMMNIMDYLTGNIDRHWGNWGLWVDNSTNKFMGLHPLMDFNRSFLSYDSIEGAKCQTAGRDVSQKEAAIEAVKQIGLNQIANVSPALFSDSGIKDMFFARLAVLKEYNQAGAFPAL